MDRLSKDLKFAARLLWRDRAFALTTLLTLAVCIGANAAIFAIINSVLLRPFPFLNLSSSCASSTATHEPTSSAPRTACPTITTA